MLARVLENQTLNQLHVYIILKQNIKLDANEEYMRPNSVSDSGITFFK